jgi:hypothetical protein
VNEGEELAKLMRAMKARLPQGAAIRFSQRRTWIGEGEGITHAPYVWNVTINDGKSTGAANDRDLWSAALMAMVSFRRSAQIGLFDIARDIFDSWYVSRPITDPAFGTFSTRSNP